MAVESAKTVVVCGATGRQGGAVARHLLAAGWRVRALTRTPGSAKARSLADQGADVVGVDLGDARTLPAAFEGAHGVYSVQNPAIAGLEGEVAQGRNVAEAATDARVEHLVYGSAGVGESTGVGSWDSKLAVEAHIRTLELPATVLRPQAFMEIMSEKAFYPAVAAWHVMPKLLGSATAVPWIAVDDLGAVAARVFAEPLRFVGRTIPLAADSRSLDECRAIWKEVRGRPPRRLPMPVRMFERVAGTDLTTMWRWSRTGPVSLDTGPTREVHPAALTVREWVASLDERRRQDGG